jgi:hypothetical protein
MEGRCTEPVSAVWEIHQRLHHQVYCGLRAPAGGGNSVGRSRGSSTGRQSALQGSRLRITRTVEAPAGRRLVVRSAAARWLPHTFQQVVAERKEQRASARGTSLPDWECAARAPSTPTTAKTIRVRFTDATAQ